MFSVKKTAANLVGIHVGMARKITPGCTNYRRSRLWGLSWQHLFFLMTSACRGAVTLWSSVSASVSIKMHRCIAKGLVYTLWFVHQLLRFILCGCPFFSENSSKIDMDDMGISDQQKWGFSMDVYVYLLESSWKNQVLNAISEQVWFLTRCSSMTIPAMSTVISYCLRTCLVKSPSSPGLKLSRHKPPLVHCSRHSPDFGA